MVSAIIQARMGSTRLPGKIMLNLCGKPVLWHVINRLRHAKKINEIIVATTQLPSDDIVYDSVNAWGYKCTRGDSDDVLGRYYSATMEYPCDTVVRVTSDNPLVDPILCDEVIGFYINNNYRYVSNCEPNNLTYPYGLNLEVFSFELLDEANNNATEPYEREHVTPYMYWKNKNVGYLRNDTDYSYLRWTLDTPEDYTLINNVYDMLYHENEYFTWHDVLMTYTEHPDWYQINNSVEQKSISL